MEIKKNEIFKVFKVILILIGIVFLATLIYMIIVFFDFLNDIQLIYEKINKFSIALNTTKETDIILGETEGKNNELEDASIVYDRNNQIITKFALEKQKLISLKELPFFLTKGFIIIEDQQFFFHKGINPIRLTLAIIKNIITFGKSSGGSTITQQLAKILFTKQKRSLKRKIYELYCTFSLESKFSKNEILQIYLNSIYLGHGIYGIANASEFYFGKEVAELTIAEAALLIGMNRSPERYSPIKNKENAKRIQKIVLSQFVKYKFITKQEADFEYNRFWESFENKMNYANQSFWKTEINRSGYITEYVRQILEREFSFEKITKGGLIVETTIDLDRQILAENLIKRELKEIINKIKKINKNNILTEEEIKGLECAFVSIDYHTGEVLTLVGGKGYTFSNQLNRALQSFRQIGSCVKPFIYAIALEEKKLDGKDFQPFSKFKDEIRTYIINGKKYQPRNFNPNHQYGNMVTIYDAIKYSLNTIAIDVFDKMSEEQKDKVIELIQKAALLNEKNKSRVPKVLSLALGVCELSPFELTCAYSIFARGGKLINPIIIKKIYDKRGYVYYDYTRENNLYFNELQKKLPEEQLVSSEVSYEITQLLESVFEKGGTGWWAKVAKNFTSLAAGKSGTTQDFKDAWFVGFTDKEVSACWIGLDNNKPILIAGANSAAYIWCSYNASIASSNLSLSIPIPENMKLITVCKESGLEAGTSCPEKINFYFWKEGPIPEKCYIHSDLKF